MLLTLLVRLMHDKLDDQIAVNSRKFFEKASNYEFRERFKFQNPFKNK